jgi:flagellar biosynthesis protein FlhF
MQIKRFEAKTMAEAFKNIKQEFGPDAVILSAKTIHKERALFDRGKSTMVEVLAANDNYVLQQGKNTFQHKILNQYSHNSKIFSEDEVFIKSDQKQTGGKKPSLLKSFRISKQNPSRKDYDDIEDYNALKNQLVTNGIENEIAEEMIQRIHAAHSSKSGQSKNEIRQHLPEILSDMGIRIAPQHTDFNKQRIISLIGLTGVGKTTTIAKLAAIEILEMNRSVGVISLDNFRVGSNVLLKVFASIIGFPLQCITSAKEIKQALKVFGDRDVILVDTPGIGLKDFQLKQNIKEFMEKIKPDETHLLMHANVKHTDAKEMKQNFEFFDYNRILFTKIDETATYGTMISQLVETSKPISYITMGQNVPEDISTINLKGLVRLLMTNHESNDFKNLDVSKIKSFQPRSIFQRAAFH